MGKDAAIKEYRRQARKKTEDKIRELAGEAGLDARDVLTAEYTEWIRTVDYFNRSLEAYHLAWLASKENPRQHDHCRAQLMARMDEFDSRLRTFRAALSNFLQVTRKPE